MDPFHQFLFHHYHLDLTNLLIYYYLMFQSMLSLAYHNDKFDLDGYNHHPIMPTIIDLSPYHKNLQIMENQKNLQKQDIHPILLSIYINQYYQANRLSMIF